MINADLLLADLQAQLKRIEADLLQRMAELPALKADLQAEWQAAHNAERTAETFETWADQVITQAGVHWLLSCVFLRFIEDNGLVSRPWLSGPSEGRAADGGPTSDRLALARDRHEAYFSAHPLHSDRDYLLAAFREAGALPGLHTFFDEAHNPVFRLGISGDAAMALLRFWQDRDPGTGALKHDFTDPAWNTRFLGNLYQDLSEATRKRYALLQTPEFVEAFILDRTLTPAIREFGFRDLRLIDPTCGSGHFLLGAFARLVDEWTRAEPTRNRRDVAQKALDAVSGVDLNPFAVAIARFRLLVAALQVCGVQRLADAPDFHVSVAIGDSLLHGHRFGLSANQEMFSPAEYGADAGLVHAYTSEDLAEVQRILGRQYHAVVGNPPYIVVRDAALNAAYRRQYASCHRQYSLGVPFTERFFELAITGRADQPAGFVGLITANSFMKREFGSKLIEEVLPRLDLTHVVDTSGAYIPGHGTPTVILFGRHRTPVSEDDPIRTVMGIKGEPTAPDDAAFGLVWTAIIGQINHAGSQSDFVSVADTARAVFAKHPWSIGGGGASDVKEMLDAVRAESIGDRATGIGFFQDTHADEIFVQPESFFVRTAGQGFARPCVRGDGTRDWRLEIDEGILFPYDDRVELWSQLPPAESLRWLWSYRTTLWARSVFGGQTYREAGRPWWDYHQFPKDRAKAERLIAFAEIATHNHFVLKSVGVVFNRTAPVLMLPAGTSEAEHLGLLGLLNSSVACFWLKQVCFNKGNGGIGGGISDEKWELRYAHNASQVAEFPVVDHRPVDIATRLDAQASELAASLPTALLAAPAATPTRASLDAARERVACLRRQMVATQEELDWRCYRLYGLLPAGSETPEFESETPPEVQLGERAFEIVLARRMAAGKETSAWFERHGSTPINDLPGHWPEAYRQVVQRRIDLIETDRNIGLIERTEYKRRWNSPAWSTLEQAALRDWLLARLESPRFWAVAAGQPPQLSSTSRLADAARQDAEFMQIAALYAGHADFDPGQLVADLVASEAVPFLPVQRYTDTGLRKRAQWQDTWALQRQEDQIDAQVDDNADDWRQQLAETAHLRFGSDASPAASAWTRQALADELACHKAERKASEVGKIPVPPKYQSKDFLKADVWRLRGGLDVPKERWVSYPGCERGADGSLVIAWAGWNHLQQATALAGHYVELKDGEGWEPARLQPLLAGLLELVPWLEQWHNDLDPEFGERMGSYYRGFVQEEARALGFTLDQLRAWTPPVVAVKRGRRKAAA